jgi:DNA-binding MarR family transcriptional regulator
MTSVKPRDPHVLVLFGRLFGEARDTFATQEWGGPRASHLRLIELVLDEGISVTDLARRAGMSKQACGQFVTQLVAAGHLRVEADPADRRVRRVHRTPLGEQTLAEAIERIARIEAAWADRVGPDRYRTFRAVLEELALNHP